MNVYLVSYDLNNPGQKYSKLYELIKQFPDYIHFQDSVWIIKAVENWKKTCEIHLIRRYRFSF